MRIFNNKIVAETSPTYAEIVREVLKLRRSIPRDKYPIIAIFLLAVATKDRQAALTLFSQPNRFTQNVKQLVSEKYILDFIYTYQKDQTLLSKLFTTGGYRTDEMSSSYQKALQQERLIEEAVPNIEALADCFDQRTFAMLQANSAVAVNKLDHDKEQVEIILDNKTFPCVTRHTRDFASNALVSAGSSEREAILLDPSSATLDYRYEQLKNSLKAGGDTLSVLKQVSEHTRRLLPSIDVPEVQKNKIMTLGSVVRSGFGVCRHHALLNCYFLSKLKQDGLIAGEVIHHRQNFNQGAHTWTLLKCDGKIFSLDSLWKSTLCLSDNPGALNALYREDTVERLILERHADKPAPKEAIYHCQIFKKPIIPQQKEIADKDYGAIEEGKSSP